MRLSYSRVSTFKRNPLEFRLRYLEGLSTLPKFDAKDPLIVGTAMHELLQKNKDAIKQYYMSYPVITNQHIEEAIKLQYLSQKALEYIPPKGKYEVTLATSDFIGFIDMLVKNEDGTYDIWDFKYSNSIDNYMQSAQLHLYKYYFEQMYGKVKHLRYLFIPKIGIRKKKTENEYQFRQRLMRSLNDYPITVKEVEYDPNKVIQFFIDAKHLLEATEYPLNRNDPFWKWSEFYDYIEKGETWMIKLPENKRRTLGETTRRKLWVYGAPFTGKTTFANQFPDPLMLNTDGNTQFVDAPVLEIKDIVTEEGRRTKRTFAWEVYKDALTELEKGSEFKSIIVDLVEDLYESCRLYMYDKLGINHESDDPFKAWDEIRTEFLSTMRRTMNLNYENIILIGHEDTTRDIMARNGSKISTVRPAIQEKIANKLAGMVDIVARLVIESDGERKLKFKSEETTFGGGRLHDLDTDEIPLDYDNFVDVYNQALKAPTKKRKQTKLETPKEETPKDEQPVEEAPSEQDEDEVPQTSEPVEDEQPVRKRRVRKERE